MFDSSILDAGLALATLLALAGGLLSFLSPCVLTVVPPYAPGTMLRLSDGRWAVAVDHVPTDPCRPIVQITPDPKHISPGEAGEVGDIVELTKASPQLCVVEADGQDTSQLNFERPALMQEELTNVMG